jgi:hypothetical protein
VCSRRRIPGRQCMPSTVGELILDLPRRRQSLVQDSPAATSNHLQDNQALRVRLSP